MIRALIGGMLLAAIALLPGYRPIVLPLTADHPQDTTSEKVISDRCDSSIICSGEELVYEVKYWIFSLGEIKLKTLPSTRVNGRIRHSTAVFVDSYDGIPFVELHAVEYTEMDSAFNSLGFKFLERKKDAWYAERSRYEADAKKLIIEKSRQKELQSPPEEPATHDTVVIPRAPFQDGLSILYFARANCRRLGTIRVPTVVFGKYGRTSLEYADKKTTLELDAFRHPVRVIEFEGRADYEGLYGLTGEFKGWLSDDAAAVPIKAEMQVVIGSVSIELKSWHRNGWKIPYERGER